MFPISFFSHKWKAKYKIDVLITTIFINKNYLNDGNGCKKIIWLINFDGKSLFVQPQFMWLKNSYSNKIVNESYLEEILQVLLPIVIVNWILLFPFDEEKTHAHTQKKKNRLVWYKGRVVQ